MLLFVGMGFSYSRLHGQSSNELFSIQQQKIEYLYAQEYQDMRQLLQGKIHQEYLTKAKGHPFWLSEGWTVGSLQTKHLYYPELMLKYDAHKDALVFGADLSKETYIWINEYQVESFWIQQKQFDYLGEGKEKTAMMLSEVDPGYFELLYEGTSKLYAKRTKRFQPYEDDYGHIGEFYDKSDYFLLKGQVFLPIKGKKELIQATKDHEGEIEQYLKQQEIRFGSISDDQLIQIIAYYESL